MVFSPAAVSYTHLDVYKRQVEKRLPPTLQAGGFGGEHFFQPVVAGRCFRRAAGGRVHAPAAGIKHNIQGMQCREQLAGMLFVNRPDVFRLRVLVGDNAGLDGFGRWLWKLSLIHI